MPSYLAIAYSIFIVFPLVLTVYIYVQRQRIKKQLAKLESEKDTAPQSRTP